MTLEQVQAVAKAVHEGLRRNGTVVLYSAAFERIVGDAIRTHLLSQDVEIERMRTNENLSTLQHNKLLAKYELAESRVAMADALLLRYCVQIGELSKGLDPHDPIFVDLQRLGADYMAHLQGAGDEA